MNQIIKDNRGRNHAIDLMKFIAAILITNSHMTSIYPRQFSQLATGGAIGDSLFFFCSGFCLMMGSDTDFFNWYKRRINRIFPTVFAVALIGIVFLSRNPTLKDVIIKGGGWFVQAIFLFYAIFWFVKRYLPDKLWIAIVLDTIIISVWFIYYWDKNMFILVNGTYLRWPCYFMSMLIGAVVCIHNKKILSSEVLRKEKSGWFWTALLIVFLLFYYGYQLLWRPLPILKDVQIVIIPALLGITYCFYEICSNTKLLILYRRKNIYLWVYGISACCLEIYLSHRMSFGVGKELINYFPLNIIITFMLIFAIAYLVKVFSNFLSQTFKTERYDWKGMVKL